MEGGCLVHKHCWPTKSHNLCHYRAASYFSVRSKKAQSLVGCAFNETAVGSLICKQHRLRIRIEAETIGDKRS